MTEATIAIITYARPLWLSRLLKSLIQQEVNEKTKIDILVVDNACEKKIKRIVEEVAAESRFKINYIEEKQPGIVAARNRAVDYFLTSNSKNLLFIDDDEWPLNTNWAQTLIDKKVLHSADIATSRVISVGEVGTPKWAVDLIYGRCVLKEGDFVKVFYTNNLLISRHVLNKIRPAFDSRFAMTGASDYHFSLKCYHAGYKAVYVDAPVKEEFPKSRATIKWFMRRGFRSGIGFTRSHIYEEGVIAAALRCSVLSIIRFLRGFAYLVIGSVLLNKTKIIDGVFRLSSSFGTIAGFFGVKHEEYKVIHGK